MLITYGINVHQRNASKTTNKCDEFVQITRSSPGNGSAEQYHEETEDVLLPLDPRVVLACTAEQLLTGDFDRWVDLQWCRKKNGERIDELHGIYHLIVLWEIENDDSLGRGTVCSVGKSAGGDKDHGDDRHDDTQDTWKLARILHSRLNRNDKANTFEGEDGRADEERPVLAVELYNVAHTMVLGESLDIVEVQVDKTESDEKVSYQSKFLNIVDIPVE